MKFELKPNNRDVSDQELIDDLRKVVKASGKLTITRDEYNELGRFSEGTLRKRFGGWLKVLEAAGFEKTRNINISIIDLFRNIEDVWIQLGRQPNIKEMRPPISKYSADPYARNFGNWRKALEAFVEFINSDEAKEEEETPNEENTSGVNLERKIIFKHKTKRFPSERLKVQVLMRDGNRCRLCGITVSGDNIHFDHIKPWTKGGETILENIQVLCERHNLAKGNLE